VGFPALALLALHPTEENGYSTRRESEGASHSEIGGSISWHHLARLRTTLGDDLCVCPAQLRQLRPLRNPVPTRYAKRNLSSCRAQL